MSDEIGFKGVHGKRLRRMRVSMFLLEKILGEGWGEGEEVRMDPPVRNLQIIRVSNLTHYNAVEFLVESPDFHELKDGDEIPEWMPTYRRIESKPTEAR